MTIARLPENQRPRIEIKGDEVIVWANTAEGSTDVAMNAIGAMDAALALLRCASQLNENKPVVVTNGSISLYAATPPRETALHAS